MYKRQVVLSGDTAAFGKIQSNITEALFALRNLPESPTPEQEKLIERLRKVTKGFLEEYIKNTRTLFTETTNVNEIEKTLITTNRIKAAATNASLTTETEGLAQVIKLGEERRGQLEAEKKAKEESEDAEKKLDTALRKTQRELVANQKKQAAEEKSAQEARLRGITREFSIRNAGLRNLQKIEKEIAEQQGQLLTRFNRSLAITEQSLEILSRVGESSFAGQRLGSNFEFEGEDEKPVLSLSEINKSLAQDQDRTREANEKRFYSYRRKAQEDYFKQQKQDLEEFADAREDAGDRVERNRQTQRDAEIRHQKEVSEYIKKNLQDIASDEIESRFTGQLPSLEQYESDIITHFQNIENETDKIKRGEFFEASIDSGEAYVKTLDSMLDSMKNLGQAKSIRAFLLNWKKALAEAKDLTDTQIKANQELSKSIDKVAKDLDDIAEDLKRREVAIKGLEIFSRTNASTFVDQSLNLPDAVNSGQIAQIGISALRQDWLSAAAGAADVLFGVIIDAFEDGRRRIERAAAEIYRNALPALPGVFESDVPQPITRESLDANLAIIFPEPEQPVGPDPTRFEGRRNRFTDTEIELTPKAVRQFRHAFDNGNASLRKEIIDSTKTAADLFVTYSDNAITAFEEIVPGFKNLIEPQTTLQRSDLALQRLGVTDAKERKGILDEIAKQSAGVRENTTRLLEQRAPNVLSDTVSNALGTIFDNVEFDFKDELDLTTIEERLRTEFGSLLEFEYEANAKLADIIDLESLIESIGTHSLAVQRDILGAAIQGNRLLEERRVDKSLREFTRIIDNSLKANGKTLEDQETFFEKFFPDYEKRLEVSLEKLGLTDAQIQRITDANLPEDALRQLFSASESYLRAIEQNTKETSDKINFDRLSSIYAAQNDTLKQILQEDEDSPLRDWLDTRQGILDLFGPDSTQSFLLGPDPTNRRRQQFVRELERQQQLPTARPVNLAEQLLYQLQEALLKGERDSAGAVSLAEINQILAALRQAFAAESITPESLTEITTALTDIFSKLNIDGAGYISRLEALLSTSADGLVIKLDPDAKAGLDPDAGVGLKPGTFVTLAAGSFVTLADGTVVKLEKDTVVLKEGEFITLPKGTTVSLPNGETIDLTEDTTVPIGPNQFVKLKAGTYVTLPTGERVQLKEDTTVPLSANQFVTLPAGTSVVLSTGETIDLTKDTTVPLAANQYVTLPAGTHITLADGTVVKLEKDTVVLADGEHITLPAGTTVSLPTGETVDLAADATVPFALNQFVTLKAGTYITFPDGTTVPLTNDTVVLRDGEFITLPAGTHITLPTGASIPLKKDTTVPFAPDQSVLLAANQYAMLLPNTKVELDGTNFITAFEKSWRGFLGTSLGGTTTTGVGGGSGRIEISAADSREFRDDDYASYQAAILAGDDAPEPNYESLLNILSDNIIDTQEYQSLGSEIRSVLGDTPEAQSILSQLDSLAGVSTTTTESGKAFETLSEVLRESSAYIVNELRPSIQALSTVDLTDNTIKKIGTEIRSKDVPVAPNSNIIIPVKPATNSGEFPVTLGDEVVAIKGAVDINGQPIDVDVDLPGIAAYVKEQNSDPLN